MKYWELIADKLGAAGWTWGYCSAVTRQGRRFVLAAYQNDGKRYIVESNELMSAFLGAGSYVAVSNELPDGSR